jgi:hypothetical protein
VVLDRRDSQASLMTISPPLVEQAGRRGVARRRFPRRWGQFDEPRLEFVGPDVGDPVADEPTTEIPEPAEAEFEVAPEVGEEGAVPVATSAEVEAEVGAEADPSPVAEAPADLTTMMKPKGRLLGRAFDVTGDQHSVLTGASGVADPVAGELPDAADGS